MPSATGPDKAAGFASATIFTMLRAAYRLLPPRFQRRVPLLLAILLAEVLLDVLGLASAVPLIYLLSGAASEPGAPTTALLGKLRAALGSPSDAGFTFALVMLVLAAFVVRHAFGVASARFQQRFVYGVAIDLIQRQYRVHVQEAHEKTRGSNTTLLARDIAIFPLEFATGVVLPSCLMITEALVVLWVTFGLALFEPYVVALLSVVVIPPLLVTRRIIKGRTHELGVERNHVRSQAYRTLTQALHAMVYVRMLDKGEFFLERMTRFFRALGAIEGRLSLLGLLPRQLIEINAVLAIAVLLATALLLGRDPGPLLPLIAVVLGASYRVMPSMTRLLAALLRLRSTAHVLDVLRPTGTAFASADPLSSETVPFEREVRFEGVSFRYASGERFVIEKLSFTVAKGECIGLVGPSGSGKTTVINILLRFLKEQDGRVLVDGRPLEAQHASAWRRVVGYVEQDPYLLDATLAENVAFGEGPEEMDVPRIERAVRSAALMPLVESLPRGVQTPVGEVGALLSGGERQRIAIARALYRDASLLIFDEATSALDPAAEAAVAQTIEGLKREGRTIVIVAHRGRLIDLCDRLYQMPESRGSAMSAEVPSSAPFSH